MGQVILLRVRAPAYPGRSAELGPAEYILLIAVGWWGGVDPLPLLCKALETADANPVLWDEMI
jgi:hypothetical protein